MFKGIKTALTATFLIAASGITAGTVADHILDKKFPDAEKHTTIPNDMAADLAALMAGGAAGFFYGRSRRKGGPQP